MDVPISHLALDKVSASTIARVKATIEARGIAPNIGARAIAGHRTMTIGAVIPKVENINFAEER
ncbi:MAG: hypothetical protein IIX61_06285 [Loktanella sp.]|nr:hypothetical protein [Loktanella sp.]